MLLVAASQYSLESLKMGKCQWIWNTKNLNMLVKWMLSPACEYPTLPPQSSTYLLRLLIKQELDCCYHESLLGNFTYLKNYHVLKTLQPHILIFLNKQQNKTVLKVNILYFIILITLQCCNHVIRIAISGSKGSNYLTVAPDFPAPFSPCHFMVSN